MDTMGRQLHSLSKLDHRDAKMGRILTLQGLYFRNFKILKTKHGEHPTSWW